MAGSWGSSTSTWRDTDTFWGGGNAAAISADEYWEVDGVALHRFAWSVETIGGSRWGLPPLRGDDRTYAYLPGRSPRPKIPDSRTMLLRMWVIGIDPETNEYVSNPRIQWNENWRYLQKLFFTPTRQITLTRRWEEYDGMHSATARAQLVGTMDPEMTGRSRATFEVELLLADPFFYGPIITETLTYNIPLVLNYGGDYETGTARDMTVRLDGQIANPRMTNSTPIPQVWFQIGSDVAVSDSVLVDVERASAVRASDDATLVGGLTHSGSRRWMNLYPGNNVVTLTGSSGSGSAEFKYRECFV